VFVITERKQYSIELGCERYWQDEQFHFAGEAAISKFPTTFFGVGNATNGEKSEDYTPRSFVVFLQGERKINSGMRMGPSLLYRNQTIVETVPGGWLDRGDVKNMIEPNHHQT